MTNGVTKVMCLAPLVLMAAAAAAPDTTRTFETDPAGRAPAGFRLHVVRYSSAPRWLVRRDGTNGFLAHEGDAGGQVGFAMAVLDTDHWRNLSLSARVRFAGGQRSGGIVWRVQDAENYYLARLDLDRQDIGLYRVVGGNRTRIEGEDDLELDTTAWHTLRIVQEGDNIRVYIGGIRVLRARDRTFGNPGGAGLWCTGDAIAQFDDLRLTTPPADKDKDDDADPRRRR